jgi:DNA-binding beta-propeller fold protein YncE
LLHAVRVGTEPTGVAVNQRTGTVYVTNFNDGTVSVIMN